MGGEVWWRGRRRKRQPGSQERSGGDGMISEERTRKKKSVQKSNRFSEGTKVTLLINCGATSRECF